MPVTPIDIATMAPKSQETAIIKNAENQKPVNDRHNANVQVENKALQNTTTTIRSKQSESPEYRYDSESNGSSKNAYSGDQGRRKRKQEQKTEQEKKYGQGIDIRI